MQSNLNEVYCEEYNQEEEIKNLMQDLNMFCCDCLAPDPDWVSVNNGIFLCIQCAGTHRAYGVDISFILSTKLDNLEPNQIELLKKGGNRKFMEMVQLYKLNKDERTKSIKYITKAAFLYRSMLQECIEKRRDLEIDTALFNRLNMLNGA